MSELITLKPKEKQKGFLNENLVINKLSKDHKNIYDKIINIENLNNNKIISEYLEEYKKFFTSQKKALSFQMKLIW